MAIKQMTKTGENFYPKTITSAVVDEATGDNLDSMLPFKLVIEEDTFSISAENFNKLKVAMIANRPIYIIIGGIASVALVTPIANTDRLRATMLSPNMSSNVICKELGFSPDGLIQVLSEPDNPVYMVKAGHGLSMEQDGTLNCTLDTNPFIVGSTLPSGGVEGKIYLIPSTVTGEQNVMVEYIWVNGTWEKLGEFKTDVDLSAYALKTEVPAVVDNLTDGGATKALSAEQGKVLNEKLTELAEEISKLTTIELDEGFYYTLALGGDVKYSPEVTFYCANVKCQSGDTFGIKGNGTNNANVWCTLNNNGKIVRKSGAGEHIGEVIIEDGETNFIFNSTKAYNPRLTQLTSFTKKINDLVSSFQFSTDNLLDKAVTPEKVSFISSVNLFNPNDIEVALGKYVTKNGLLDNSTYNTTGYIPVNEGTQYQLASTEGTQYNISARFVLFYDANKKPIGDLLANVKEVNAPEGAVWFRASFMASYWEEKYIQVSVGSNPIPFQPYQLIIGHEYLPSTDFNGNNFYIPKDIYVASGRTIELYYSQILLNYHKYNIKAQCSIGASLERKFQIKGDDAHIGNYPLTISVYDDNANLLASALTTIHIVDASVDNITILPIGDSLTNGKNWLAEVRNLSNNAVSFVGTRKTGYGSDLAIRHEGRSGGSCRMYNTDEVSYTYNDSGYDGVGAAAATFDSSKSYAVGDFCKYGDAVYVFTSAHSGAWNASHVRNISQSNPFWDWTNNKFSINHYKSFYGINYNAIMIFLGTNGISLTPKTNENGALGIKTLVENIRKEDTTTPIIVVNTIYRSGQNGIGTQGNTDGYKAQSEFKFDADRKVMLLAKAVEDMIGDMENVYICPVGFTHDSEYNFGNVKKEVNPRLTDTSEVFELFPLDSVHPQLEGYLQMADEIFSTICAV